MASTFDTDFDYLDGDSGYLGQALADGGFEEAHLGGPAGLIDFDRQGRTVEAEGLNVLGDGIADRFRPASEDATVLAHQTAGCRRSPRSRRATTTAASCERRIRT
jgi:hypothetical protein